LALFVSFEGGEGSGKSTQAELLLRRLQQTGVSSILTREPGTTSLGRYLRNWLKQQRRSEETISHGAELLLFAAARAEFVAKFLRPALEQQGTVVIADRYADSTTAYQGYGRRLRLSDVALVNRLATQGLMPHLTFLLDCPPVEGLKRVEINRPLGSPETTGEVRVDEEGSRRFEEESLGFHQRVRAGYLKMADQQPDRWCVIDATKAIGEIVEIVWGRVQARLARGTGVEAGTPDSDLPLWAHQDPAMERPR
jgi:dTMP kinase